MKRLIILNFIVLLIIVSSAPAATRLVPDEYPTIQAAIDDCNDGDVVAVADGTYTGGGNRDIDFLGKAITVRSENGPENCIIDCNGTANKSHRGFYFHNNEDLNSVLDGFTIKNGYDHKGAGICCYGSSPRIDNCIFSRNSAEYGGGMLNHSGNPILTNCRFSGNSARYGGGMLNHLPGSPVLINCTFSKNSAEYGGGIINEAWRTPTLTNCILWGDSPEEIFGHPPVITYCNVQGGWSGEGNIDADPLFVDANNGDYRLRYGSPCIDAGTNNPPVDLPETDPDGKPRIANGIVDMGACEFGPDWYVDGVNGDDNNDGLSPETAFATIQKGIDSAEIGETISVYPAVYHETIDFLGKAITVQSAEDAAVLQAQDYFAVLFCNGEGPDSVLKNFIIRNSFMAIYIENGSPTISNVTIADNGFGIAAYTGSHPNISNSIFWNNIFGDLFGCQATYSCVQNGCLGPGNLDIDPRFTEPESGDYHLQSKHGRYWPQYDIWILDEAFSPCIDGGDPNAFYSNEPMPNGGRVNMGAYGGTAYASMKEMRWLHSDTNHDGWVNLIDFAMIALDWLKYEPGTSNLPPEVSIIYPEDGTEFEYDYREPILIEIEADALDPDGSVEWVEFLADGEIIGEDNNGVDGWTTDWQPSRYGYYSLTAEATDDDGATTTSQAVEIRVGGPSR